MSRKLVLLITLNKFADYECSYLSSLILALGKDRFDVKTVSLTKDAIVSLSGLTVCPDYDFQTCPKQFEGLVLVGGNLWRTEEAAAALPLITLAAEQKKIIGGICNGAGYLGTMGLLNNIKHTANDLQDLKMWAGKKYTGDANFFREQAVRDNNIITANGTACLEFAKEMLEALEVTDVETIEQWYNFYKLGVLNDKMPQM